MLDRELPGNFAKVRAALKPFVGGDLSRVVYVTYGNPALAAPGTPCPGGRDGFDVHPAFAGRRRASAQDRGIRLQSGSCPGSRRWRCAKTARAAVIPSTERMTFVDAHQPAFASHGACARSDGDPAFDRAMLFGEWGDFREQPAKAATDPMACGFRGQRIPSLRVARALDPHCKRQLLHRLDLSGGAAVAAAARRPARCHLGSVRGRLWWRHSSDRGRSCRHGGRCALPACAKCSACRRRSHRCTASRCPRRKIRARPRSRRPRAELVPIYAASAAGRLIRPRRFDRARR